MLSAQAESIAALAQQLQARVEGMEFEGPAATRFRGAMADQSRRASQLAGELQDLSNYVLRAAARVEAQLAELRQEELQREQETQT
jgi:hypothetical protein